MTTTEHMTISPATTQGSVLASRSLASDLRRQIEREAAHRDVTVDFSGVRSMSPSFADEIFVKTTPEVRERVTFVNIPPHLQNLVRFVERR